MLFLLFSLSSFLLLFLSNFLLLLLSVLNLSLDLLLLTDNDDGTSSSCHCMLLDGGCIEVHMSWWWLW